MGSRRWLRSVGFVARAELALVRKSRALALGTLVFSVAVAAIVWTVDPPERGTSTGNLVAIDPSVADVSSTAGVIYVLAGDLPLLLVFLAVAGCCGAFAGEYERRTIRTLQSLPVSRSAVVFGKLLGRATILAAVVVCGLAFGAAVASYRYGLVAPGPYAAFTVVSVAFTIVLAAVVLAVSATVSTRLQAIAFSLGPLLIVWVVGVEPGLGPTLRSPLPIQPYHLLVAEVHDHLFALPRFEAVLAVESVSVIAEIESAEDFESGGPVYLRRGGAIAILAAWFVTSLSIAVGVHRRRDL